MKKLLTKKNILTTLGLIATILIMTYGAHAKNKQTTTTTPNTPPQSQHHNATETNETPKTPPPEGDQSPTHASTHQDQHEDPCQTVATPAFTAWINNDPAETLTPYLSGEGTTWLKETTKPQPQEITTKPYPLETNPETQNQQSCEATTNLATWHISLTKNNPTGAWKINEITPNTPKALTQPEH